MVTGCASARIPHAPGDPPPSVSDGAAELEYQGILEKFTASQGVYDNLDSKLFFRATWQSPRFVEARIRREGVFRVWPTAEGDARLAQEQARLSGAVEFFFAVHANDYRFDDFEKSTSMWRMALVTDAGEVTPVSIERLGRSNIEMRSAYSYMESFWVGYRVRFEHRGMTSGERFRLRVASAVGRAELEYVAD